MIYNQLIPLLNFFSFSGRAFEPVIHSLDPTSFFLNHTTPQHLIEKEGKEKRVHFTAFKI